MTYGQMLTQIESRLGITQKHCSVDGRIKDVADFLCVDVGRGRLMSEILSDIMNRLSCTCADKLISSALKAILDKCKREEESGVVLTLLNCMGSDVISLEITGNSVQEGIPTPENPIAIKNVGTLVTEGEHAGKYAVPIKIHGKNLFSTELEEGSYSSTGEPTSTNVGFRTKYAIHVTENTVLKLSERYGLVTKMVAHFYDSNDINILRDTADRDLFVVPQGAVSVRFRCFAEDFTENFADLHFQLEIGNAATNYEPYHEPVTKTIYLDEPLRQSDTLEVVSGKLIKRRGNISSYAGEVVGDIWISTTGELSNGAHVEYELASPVQIDISGQNISTFEGTTIIKIDTETQPSNMVCEYYADGGE